MPEKQTLRLKAHKDYRKGSRALGGMELERPVLST